MQPRWTEWPTSSVVQQGRSKELSNLGHWRKGHRRSGVEPGPARQRHRFSGGGELQV